MKRVPPEVCARCKGYRRLCGARRCPILERVRSFYSAGWDSRRPEGPTPPSPLVGEAGYPKVPVSLGISPYGDPTVRDSPELWARGGFDLEAVAKLRMEMIFPFKKFDARRPEELLKGDLLWGAVSERPVDAEAKALGRPLPPSLDGILAPVGASVRAEEIKVIDNPKVDPLLERRSSEGLKAEEAVKELFRKGRSIYLIQKAFSVGMFGVKKRLVPTRWAITAVDVAVAKAIKEDMKGLPWVGGPKVGVYSHYGNVYKVLLVPGPPIVEMVEVWEPRSLWTPKEVTIYNYEGPTARSKALDPDDGGFHALKVGVLKALKERGVSATALVIRRVTPDYYLPLGAWQVREGSYMATLKALDSGDMSLKEALERLQDEKVVMFKSLRQRSLSEYTLPAARRPRT
ncbi:Nre family DNA repair protein [Ignicoccus hospitalis]|uniref:DNA repair protein n=1 Tax=Ignicoccus hospitalis (strain KIN4/I / DSM 18386 / JCM 14125) TaxID=453591 RepID=A8AAS1_IGNH4|nr:Nre family DNA repair protein [Ignicoccus hospitalis]ABU82023.1 Protein of unknown function DUF650, N-terminal domain [Ignicoccus hospitalis KIN4/I]HIH90980.1 hypothetical protein [Desulfurococcaceae archaeon]